MIYTIVAKYTQSDKATPKTEVIVTPAGTVALIISFLISLVSIIYILLIHVLAAEKVPFVPFEHSGILVPPNI